MAIAEKEALIDRLLRSTAGVFDIFTLYIGDRLGFYKVLADRGWLTSLELADATCTHERYVREWLEQQTVSGILEVEDETAQISDRRFGLPAGHAEVLLDIDSLEYLAPIARLLVGVTRPIDAVLDAYRSGGGVPFSKYGTDLREGQAGINRPMFLKELGSQWISAMPDVCARLNADPPARVADIGCGGGWSSIGLAQAYPNVRVDGYDLDAPSVALARQNVENARLSDRVSIQQRDAADFSLAGQYDLVMAFECIHDMGNPVGALSTMRHLAGDTGTVLVADERVGETFTAKGNDVEWMMYGWSVLHCLPVGMADGAECHCGGTGTVMRPETLYHYAREAGFSRVEILPIDNFFFRFYRLQP
ncbi:methyltransferase domain-containing protein [Oscillatoriales cyanobacterium LEGE 11467]|uniref:Methyltransferase domain-containing protein n=2 Tax=Zarconia TaxID=2992130 RepID=A0A928Z7J3_9CYAN|nr:methyltransferase domain-containing protein [Zarconia navalis LEGE 11467]